MSRETKVAAIPDIRSDNVTEVLTAIKNVLQVREGHIGDALDQNATLRDLVDLSVLQVGGSTSLTSGTSVPVVPSFPPITGYNPSTDFVTPPAPSGLRAVGGFTNVYLEWDGAPFKNPAYTEIWRAEEDNLGLAVMIGTTSANVYADPANPDTTYYYWIRFVSNANVTGPYNQTSGTVATTAIDVSKALKALTTEITNSQLYTDLGSRITRIEDAQSISSSDVSLLKAARASLNDQISKNGSAIVSVQKVTDTQATLITSLGTRVGESESNITNLQLTTGSQATSITQLSTTVGGHTTSIQTLTGTTDGLSGQYTVKIDNNGHVSGFGLASTTVNGTPTSAFIVRADKFAIAGANDTTDPLGTVNPTKLPFIVTTTDTVINGKTYPAGTWIDTAFIANATITNAQIGSLTADKITTGSLTAAVGITTGRISGGVNTSQGFGTANFGTGFFLGLDSSVFKFRVGSFAKNMTWDGTDLSITGNIAANTATFRGITITDNAGNVLLSSGGIPSSVISGLGALATQSSVTTGQVTGLGTLATQSSVTTGQVTGLGTLATQNSVSTSQVTGLGTLATQNSVSTSQVTGLGSLATQNNVFIGSNVQIWNGSSYVTLNTGDFVNSLSKINSGNISTFISSAAIGDAYIGNLSAAKITTGTMAADRIGAGSIAVGQAINSSNYVAGSAGWQINGSGNAEFNQITVRSGQVTGALLKILRVPNFISGLQYQINFGTPISTTDGPYYLDGTGNPWFVVWSGTMPAPETAAHRIAGVVTVNASNLDGSSARDLSILVMTNVTVNGTSFSGDQIGYATASGPYNFTVTGAGASGNTYSGSSNLRILVGGYLSNNQVGVISGLFWGVR